MRSLCLILCVGLCACGRAAIEPPVPQERDGGEGQPAPQPDAGSADCSPLSTGQALTLAHDVATLSAARDEAGRELVALGGFDGQTQLWRQTAGGFELLGVAAGLGRIRRLVAADGGALLLTDDPSTGGRRLWQWSDGWTERSLPGAPLSEPQLASVRGQVLLGVSEPPQRARLFRWVGDAWEPISEPIADLRLAGLTVDASGAVIAAGLRLPEVRVSLLRWNGAQWERLADLEAGLSHAGTVELITTPDGTLVAAWSDAVRIHVARASPAGWTQTELETPSSPLLIRLALDGSGALWLAAMEQARLDDSALDVWRWSGAEWVHEVSHLRAGASGDAELASLWFDGDAPVLWWREVNLPVGDDRRAVRWSPRGCGAQ